MMKKELELKFIVDPKKFMDVVRDCRARMHITQGYLFGNSHIRVRNIISLDGRSSFLTIKSDPLLSIGNDRNAIERDEFEYSIPYEEGVALLENLATAVISKTRYLIINDKNNWEVDDFHGKNHGIILAEIEIPQEDYDLSIPHWIQGSTPVSDDNRYYNYNLAMNPFSEWGI